MIETPIINAFCEVFRPDFALLLLGERLLLEVLLFLLELLVVRFVLLPVRLRVIAQMFLT